MREGQMGIMEKLTIDCLRSENWKLQARARELEAQVAQLQRSQGAQTTDIIHDDVELLTVTLAQRERLRAERDEYKQAFNQANQIVEAREAASFQDYSEQVRLFQEEHGEHGSPLTAQWAQAAYKAVEQESKERVNKVTQAIIKRGGVSLPEWLDRLIDMSVLIGQREVTIKAFKHWRVLQNNPYVVCFEIAWEFWKHGKTYIETVSRLKPIWIKQNITDNRSVSPHKLWEDLNDAYQYQKGELTMRDFAYKHHIGEDTLSLSVKYLKRVRELAYLASDELKEQFPDVLD
jgi:hypothetical protein